MPILDDIMDHSVLGPERRRGIAIGMEKGERKVRTIILRQIAQRFGPPSASTWKRIATLPFAKLERIGLRLPDAASLDELLP